jgi:hypothetical protein
MCFRVKHPLIQGYNILFTEEEVEVFQTETKGREMFVWGDDNHYHLRFRHKETIRAFSIKRLYCPRANYSPRHLVLLRSR